MVAYIFATDWLLNILDKVWLKRMEQLYKVF